MKMPADKLKAVRKLLAGTHGLHADTDIVAGEAAPQYAGEPGKGAVMTVGFLWLKANHPQEFAEAATHRLNPTA